MDLPKSYITPLPQEGIQTPQPLVNAEQQEPRVVFSLPLTKAAAQVGKAATTRLRSLDAFRGLTILLMLLVNNVALDSGTPKQLQHAPWNAGVTMADFVFPWFLFCVGVSIPFAAASFRRKGLPAWSYDLKIIGRAVVLVLLGCLIDSSLQRRPQFSLGVLQNIGLAYLVASMLYDLPIVRRMLIAAAMLLGYWAAIMFIPVPGMGQGALGETQNLIWHINMVYLNPVHLWGLPSIISTAALVLIGTGIGDLLRNKELLELRRVAMLGIVGSALLVLGFLWSLNIPFNKGLWTPSYVLLTAGTGTIILGVFYLILDTAQWWQWAYPLLVFGSNAIVAYVAPILTKLWILQVWQIGKPGATLPIDQWLQDSAKAHCGPIAGGWLFTWGYILVWWAVLWLLYRKRLFLRV